MGAIVVKGVSVISQTVSSPVFDITNGSVHPDLRVTGWYPMTPLFQVLGSRATPTQETKVNTKIRCIFISAIQFKIPI